ncbi:MAG TPA: fructose-6-phosphate aldolase [Dehalococcoidia bacterium]|nr:fructose-6-phosphate aldolase [Dehalococcoidia bacterium]
MRLFLDTANIEEIREAASWGVVNGITTNPTLVAQAKHRDLKSAIMEIVALVPGHVSVEVTALEPEGMLLEAREYARWSNQVVVKLPATAAGLQALTQLGQEDIAVNMTLCFSANQAILAAIAGAAYISPFVGRLDDVGHDGMALVAEIVGIYRTYQFRTQVLAASLRHPLHVIAAAKAGAQVATMPFRVLQQMIQHPLTDVGQERFLKDWRTLHS